MSLLEKTFGNVWIIEKEVGRAPHPASLADLVEVLKEHGAEEVTVGPRKDQFAPAIYTGEGRYLVLPLDGTPK